jgi:hypothetical protein
MIKNLLRDRLIRIERRRLVNVQRRLTSLTLITPYYA